MSFHADFWVVAGTAAPVIALSSILVSGDQLQLAADLARATRNELRDIPFWRWPGEYRSMYLWYMVTGIVTAGQALILFASLMSLVQESNYVPPTLTALAESASLIILSASILILVKQKDWAKEVGQKKHSVALSSKRLGHPSRRAQINASRRANRYRVAHQIANARSARRGPQPRK
jgi:hypothetical protein